MLKKIPGRVTVLQVTSVSQLLIPASKGRTAIVFLPPAANRVTYMPEPTVADTVGLNLINTTAPITVTGDLARAQWAAIQNTAGPNPFPIIEYFDPEFEGE